MKKLMILVGLLALAFPAWAQSNEQLARDNAELKTRLSGLEARVAQLEGRMAPVAPEPLSGKALDLNQWRKCGPGMSKEEVVKLLGKPTTERFVSGGINGYPDSESWTYGPIGSGPGGTVIFMGGKVFQCFSTNLKTHAP